MPSAVNTAKRPREGTREPRNDRDWGQVLLGQAWDLHRDREITGLLPAVDLLGVDTGAAALRAGLKLLFEPLAPD
jgi:hypothetical protein